MQKLDQQGCSVTAKDEDSETINRDWRVKVYVVVQKNNLALAGEPNINVLAAKLTRTAAQSIVDKMPGTSIIKLVADKG